VNNFLIHK